MSGETPHACAEPRGPCHLWRLSLALRFSSPSILVTVPTPFHVNNQVLEGKRSKANTKRSRSQPAALVPVTWWPGSHQKPPLIAGQAPPTLLLSDQGSLRSQAGLSCREPHLSASRTGPPVSDQKAHRTCGMANAGQAGHQVHLPKPHHRARRQTTCLPATIRDLPAIRTESQGHDHSASSGSSPALPLSPHLTPLQSGVLLCPWAAKPMSLLELSTEDLQGAGLVFQCLQLGRAREEAS